MSSLKLGVAIPTYQRGAIALESVRALLALPTTAHEILVVDQTLEQPPEVKAELQALDNAGSIRWLRLATPSIPAAMNVALQESYSDALLFLDDDIVPDPELVAAHVAAQADAPLVAGMVLQPGEQVEPLRPGEPFRFNSDATARIREFMGGNFSVNREVALSLGGFDENFVGAAYRFEAEFAWRYGKKHGLIHYEPRAVIHHLAVASGGTRAHGHHLRTAQPAHSVGEYYFWLRTRQPGWLPRLLLRPLRAIRTRHHLRRPWWIPLALVAEIRGMALALKLAHRGPKLMSGSLPIEGPSGMAKVASNRSLH